MNKKYTAKKIVNGKERQVHDDVVVEEALQITINGKPYTVTMRTPGDDIFLVRGLLFTENIYRRVEAIKMTFLAENDNDNASSIGVWIPPDSINEGYYVSRSMLSVSSCGICGKRELDDVFNGGIPLEMGEIANANMIRPMFSAMKAQQITFHQTGGAHAAAAFDINGDMLAICEDIGRHNAVDKVIGRLLEDSILEQATFLLVSGRISYEITSKCYMAGIPYLAAVSSPSSLSINFAHEMGITLLGFCRDDSMTCYSHPERIVHKQHEMATLQSSKVESR